jgi:TatD DNase family protein
MIRDIHTHHYPNTSGEAIVQLMPDAFYPQQGHFYSVGLHPWEIKDDWRTQMAGLLVKALHPQVAMIGETGIDKKNGAAPLEVQMEVFREHVRLSELLRKPLIIHCVKGFDEVLAIRKEMKAALPWLIHGFRGGIEQWQQLSRAGLLVSIGEHYDEELVKELPLSQRFIESDDRGDIDAVYRAVSLFADVEEENLRFIVHRNIIRVLQLEASEPYTIPT